MSKLEILYNAECPICSREIEHYKKLPASELEFVPIAADALEDWGLEEDMATKKLHARMNGQHIEGVEAFMALWARLPYYRRLSQILRFKPLKLLLEAVYTRILAPVLFRMHKARQAKASRGV